ncbi:PAS domain-containing protein [Rugamonas sp.]|uniref:hybrid sensor histidine kinase/response regulator n=1 Tax=Rugamonas sp. TaxID=1926287 RepID=UPI0025EE4441|nr:PAS domain-containing protein [Rugamonas sp.]
MKANSNPPNNNKEASQLTFNALDSTQLSNVEGNEQNLNQSRDVNGNFETDKKSFESLIANTISQIGPTILADSAKLQRAYETVLTNTSDLVYVFGLDHRVIYANDTLLSMWGLNLESSIGKTLLEIGYTPAHATMHSKEFDLIVTTQKPIRGEVSFNGANGYRRYDYIFVPVIGENGEVEAIAGTARDVSERMKIVEQLREGQEQLDFALSAAKLGHWALDLIDNTSIRTARHDEIFGYDPQLTEWTYEMFIEHVVPTDRLKVDADFHLALNFGLPWSVECKILRADGALRYIWSKGVVKNNFDGKPIRMVGIIGDVTERRHAEELQAFQMRLSETLRPLSRAIDVQAEASRVLGEQLGANRVVYFEIMGDEYIIERDFTAGVQPLAGKYPVDSFGPMLLESLLKGITVVESDATNEINRSQYEKDAFKTIQVRAHVDVPLVKNGQFVAGMTVHISERRDWFAHEIVLIQETAERTWAALEKVRAEAALKISEERLSMVRNSSGVGFWYCDLPFNILEWDEVVKKHFHLSPHAVVTIQNFYELLHPDDREITRQAIERSIVERASYDVIYRTINPSFGAVKWIRAIGHAFYTVDGVPIRFDGVTIDVSEQKKAEEILRDASREKDNFIAILAHELRNPLAPLKSGVQLIKSVDSNQVIAQACSIMERQLIQMTRLVDDLLDISRVNTNKLQLHNERIQLNEVISSAIEISRHIIAEKGQTLSIELSDDSIYLDGDSVRLSQVLANLLNNSAKYTHDGGHISLSVCHDSASVTISIVDNGIGIPENMLNDIFTMFTQVDRTLEKTTGGLGLGLSLAKSLVNLHGGTINAFSEGEGLGSKFIINLPVSTTNLVDMHSVDSIFTTPILEFRILVIDDNEDAAELLALLLQFKGNEVRTAYDGESGIVIGSKFKPDVVICDIGMPKMNGFDTARFIRNVEWGENAILVALTGWGQEKDMQKSVDAGFNYHLVKPVDIDALMLLLQKAK